jgi:hypothetical protein
MRNLKRGSDPISTGLQERKLQNFGRRSYRFAAAVRVFHPHGSRFARDPRPEGITGLARKRR